MPTQKIKERKAEQKEGFGAHPALFRVVEVADNAELPPGAEKVPDETPVSDWQPEEN